MGRVTALELRARRVRFLVDGGLVRVVGPRDDELREALAGEVSWRADSMRRGLPLADVPVELLAVVSPPPARVAGSCWSCGDEREPGRGAQCELCTMALQRVLRETGRLAA